ncbi:NUDIX hydrolase [Anaerobacillus alkaliphilus]|uniref:NUDIX hydrolase n=1 Tax=Anaerobacillus alkaliphilus TaxID=1548597 RepID=A0A4Q0VWG5_9BACI|nr:NUDIX hydrolase [Anaerobacillus alkaliphilus]RXJ01840.1 NUDIX hydrolase [Anaerobacillus alkaliphilus]
MKKDRSNIWLAAAGIVIKEGKWLVVKKKYGGLKGLWSIPAGFVHEGETVDEAAVREVAEETGVLTRVKDIVGIRTGVINETISDNMIVFLLEETGGSLEVQEGEIEAAEYLSKEQLEADPNTSMMVHLFLKQLEEKSFKTLEPNPGDIFQYSSYKIFY